MGELWRSGYEIENLEEQLADIYSEIEPLYRELHAFARHRLKEKFPEVNFPKSGHIPAHLLGTSISANLLHTRTVTIIFVHLRVTNFLYISQYEVNSYTVRCCTVILLVLMYVLVQANIHITT